MPKTYSVSLKTVVEICIGKIQAESEEEALKQAENMVDFDKTVSKNGIVLADGSYKTAGTGLDLVSWSEGEHAYAIVDEYDKDEELVEPEARLYDWDMAKGFVKRPQP